MLEAHFQHRELMFVVEGGGLIWFKEFAKKGIGVAIVPDCLFTSSDARGLFTRRLSHNLSQTYNAADRKDHKMIAEKNIILLRSHTRTL